MSFHNILNLQYLSACVIFRSIYKEEKLLCCPFYLTIYICLYQLMLARALSDLEFCKCLDPVKEEICDVDLHFFFFFLGSKAILDSQYSVAFCSSLSQNSSAWCSDGISMPREIKGCNIFPLGFSDANQPELML